MAGTANQAPAVQMVKQFEKDVLRFFVFSAAITSRRLLWSADWVAASLRRDCRVTHLGILVLLAALPIFDNGCFVLRSEWRNKPEAPPQAIEPRETHDGETLARIFDTPEFRLEVAVENGPLRWEAPFLLYIIPIPTSYPYLATQPLRVDLTLIPKVGQVAFDPWQTFFVGTNQARVAPAAAWHVHQWFQTNDFGALPLVTNTSFVLQYSPWDEVPPDRALPFQLEIEGLKASGRTIWVPPIIFKPVASVRPGFKLPY